MQRRSVCSENVFSKWFICRILLEPQYVYVKVFFEKRKKQTKLFSPHMYVSVKHWSLHSEVYITQVIEKGPILKYLPI